ncbi:multiple cyclophane-containing RiPP AmcA [Catenulispora rubra]|uniref:multiple cyclophane-containing RiPP AmcA n=1 Tax=Catenulispora rubra TaxID=280293 RepID=UPI001892669E|nr:multiple cyclophane-containing RiPP AmcA [Catenulispora rubra]
MSPLATLLESDHPTVLALAGGTAPTVGKWDNRATWDNATAPFDNRPTWDNWSKRK